uniref:Uncharacterized protein n=1 Tax=Lepeophtheirus salmonis TaxID=72036 RepID=A0A0K2UQQ5_LEPSM
MKKLLKKHVATLI